MGSRASDVCRLDDSAPATARAMAEDDFVRVPGDSAFPLELVDIVMWTNKARSAFIFFAGVGIYYVTNFRGWSYMSLTALGLLIHLIWTVKSNLQQKGKNTAPESSLQVDSDLAHNLLSAVLARWNGVLAWYDDVLSGKYLSVTFQVAGMWLVVWRFGSWVSDDTLLFTAFVGAMLGPLVYSSNRELLDPKIAVLTAPIRKAWSMSRTSIPKALPENFGKKAM